MIHRIISFFIGANNHFSRDDMELDNYQYLLHLDNNKNDMELDNYQYLLHLNNNNDVLVYWYNFQDNHYNNYSRHLHNHN